MADLLELAERCEKAEGASVLLDRQIYDALGFVEPADPSEPYCPRYTASIDAAMTLILDGTDLVTFFLDVTAAMQRAGVNSRDALARFTSAAALRARATQASPTPDIHTPNGDRG